MVDLYSGLISVAFSVYILICYFIDTVLGKKGRPLTMVGYKKGSPNRKHTLSDDQNTSQPKLVFSGKVTNKSGAPIKNATLDVWHANWDGVYSVLGYNCRGVIKTNEKGEYSFETVVPGTVSLRGLLSSKRFILPRMLNFYRQAPSIQFIVSADGKTKQEQIFTNSVNSKSGAEDKTFVKLVKTKPDDISSTEYYSGTYNFVL
ncbi:catechol 1,2-dioxygenase [Acrasis kona]|uniref:Catechol 1,2-dioxygenase n=1 Tax=Acrasis kona TaxID=1008807 RepID=A0AAW2ZLI7_9EUKA